MRLALGLLVAALFGLAVGWWFGHWQGTWRTPGAPAEPPLAGLDAALRELERENARLREQVERLDAVIQKVAGASGGEGGAAGRGTPLPPRPLEVSLADSPSLGPEDAPVTVVEFSDFQCPHCATMAPVLDRISRAYPREVRLVFKHSPLAIHPRALAAHKAAVAAQLQGKFWEMHALLFSHQDRADDESLREYARLAGLNREQFEEDFESREVLERISADRAEANAAGITKVPTFFLNGMKLEGAHSYEALELEIEAELARLSRARQR